MNHFDQEWLRLFARMKARWPTCVAAPIAPAACFRNCLRGNLSLKLIFSLRLSGSWVDYLCNTFEELKSMSHLWSESLLFEPTPSIVNQNPV